MKEKANCLFCSGVAHREISECQHETKYRSGFPVRILYTCEDCDRSFYYNMDTDRWEED